MAKQTFTIWDNFPINNTAITGNGTFELAVSAEQINTVDLRSMKLVLDYQSILPPSEDAQGNTLPISYDIDAVVEGYFGGRWYPIAYQFSPMNRPSRGPTRILQLQPDIAGFDAGVDDIIFVGNSVVARVSRQQGNLPDTKFRVCILATERDFGGPGAFQSLVLSASGEAFDA
jgi:hypothetical protein